MILIKKYDRKAVTNAWKRISMQTWSLSHDIGTYQDGGVDILGKNDALELDDKEVDELLDVSQHCLEGLAREGVVSLRSHLASKALSEDELADNLRCCRASQQDVKTLQCESRDWQVACGEDEGDEGDIADSGCARVLPGEQVVEEGVVVCELLAVGCLGLRGLTRGGEVVELGLGGVGLSPCFLGHRTVGDALESLRVLDAVHCGLGGSLGVCGRG